MTLDIYSSYSHFVTSVVSLSNAWKIIVVLTAFGLVKVALVIRKYARRRAEYSQLLPSNTYPWYDFIGDFRVLLSSDLLKKGKSLHAALLDMHLNNIKKFKKDKLMCYWASYVPVLLTWNAEAAEVLLQDKEKEGKGVIYKYLEPLFGTGLLTSDYIKWKPRRKLLAPCFHADVLKTFMPVFNEQAQTLSKYLQNKKDGDFVHIGLPITLCTMEILLQTILGVKLEVQDNTGEQYVKSVRSVAKLVIARITNFWWWPGFIFYRTKQGKEVTFHQNYINDFVRSVIKGKKNNFLSQEPEEKNTKRKALLDYLLVHLQTKELSEDDIIEEVITFSAAGQGTTANSICWALYSIGLHKDIQEKIHEELDRVLGEDVERPVSIEDIKELKYLDRVLKETKRFYPPVPVIPKRIGEDLDVCGYRIPKGTICFVMAYAVHRDENVFQNPHKFDPDRFLPENTADRHPFAYIPFSAGPRNCIGSKFARMEEVVIVSTILRHFTIEAIDQSDQVPILDMTLRPAIPIQVKFTPRR